MLEFAPMSSYDVSGYVVDFNIQDLSFIASVKRAVSALASGGGSDCIMTLKVPYIIRLHTSSFIA